MKRPAVFLLALLTPAAAFAYPNGTPMYVTDAAPFCASCHSAVKAEYMPELPADAAKKETVEAKHYGLVRMPYLPSPYTELTQPQKDELIRIARLIDSNSTVTVSAPARVTAGQEVTVTVTAKGGNGPVIGIMLVDKALRFQARPIQSSGWVMSAEPEVRGQDGSLQKSWLDKRIKGTERALSYINIENQSLDADNKKFPEGTVVYKLRAPGAPGAYTLAAAFLYGTENTDKAGFFQRPSGRILFSDEITVTVQ